MWSILLTLHRCELVQGSLPQGPTREREAFQQGGVNHQLLTSTGGLHIAQDGVVEKKYLSRTIHAPKSCSTAMSYLLRTEIVLQVRMKGFLFRSALTSAVALTKPPYLSHPQHSPTESNLDRYLDRPKHQHNETIMKSVKPSNSYKSLIRHTLCWTVRSLSTDR